MEVAAQDGMILLRDSQEPHGSVHRHSAEEWRAFVRGIRAGEFEDLCPT